MAKDQAPYYATTRIIDLSDAPGALWKGLNEKVNELLGTFGNLEGSVTSGSLINPKPSIESAIVHFEGRPREAVHDATAKVIKWTLGHPELDIAEINNGFRKPDSNREEL